MFFFFYQLRMRNKIEPHQRKEQTVIFGSCRKWGPNLSSNKKEEWV